MFFFCNFVRARRWHLLAKSSGLVKSFVPAVGLLTSRNDEPTRPGVSFVVFSLVRTRRAQCAPVNEMRRQQYQSTLTIMS